MTTPLDSFAQCVQDLQQSARLDDYADMAACCEAVAKRIALLAVAGELNGAAPMLYNPYTGALRDLLDVMSDPHGRLILQPGAPVHAADDSRRAQIERTAKMIYGTWSKQPGWVPWIDGSNSTMQDKARHLARTHRVAKSDGAGYVMLLSDGTRLHGDLTDTGEFVPEP